MVGNQPYSTNCFQLPMKKSNGLWAIGRALVESTRCMFSLMIDELMVRHRPIWRGVQFIPENRLMVEGEKRVMTCHAMSTSMCCVMSVNLTPQDDVSCHFSNFHFITEVVDDWRSGWPNWGSVFEIWWILSTIDEIMVEHRLNWWGVHSPIKIVDGRWSDQSI